MVCFGASPSAIQWGALKLRGAGIKSNSKISTLARTPKDAPFILSGSLQFSDAALRLYAHPQLLAVAASINGRDFAPFNEVLFIKDPGLGAAVSWHQDGDTHWTNPDFFDEDIHGFNFMAQVYGSSPVNGVWVVPGTHKLGKLDITKMVEASGSERIDGAVSIVCDPGDVVMCNRQLVHGSFANSGFEPRLTINFGFHKQFSPKCKGCWYSQSAAITYTDEVISERCESHRLWHKCEAKTVSA